MRRTAADLDIALVIGNTDARQLPSKAIEYLTLPVPRLALTGGMDGDALTDYVEGKPGWLTVNANDADAPARVRAHLGRRWTPEELAPPAEEAWGAVSHELATFVIRCMDAGGPRFERHAALA